MEPEIAKPENENEDSPSGLSRFLPIAIIVVAAIVGYLTLRDHLSFAALAEHQQTLLDFRDAHYFWAVLTFMFTYQLVVTFSLPGAALATLTGGFLFGVFPGFLYSVIAATSGACLIFLAARRGFGDRLAKRMDASEGLVKRIKVGLADNELSILFLIRLVPVVPFFVANLVPSLVGIKLSRFAFTTFFGIIPGSLVYTWVGAGWGEVLGRGEEPDMGIIFEPNILGPILGLCALAVLPMIVKAVRGKKLL